MCVKEGGVCVERERERGGGLKVSCVVDLTMARATEVRNSNRHIGRQLSVQPTYIHCKRVRYYRTRKLRST